jgi:hypothetical protein
VVDSRHDVWASLAAVVNNGIQEKLVVMASPKRMIGVRVAAMLSLALVAPLAVANPLNGLQVRGGNRVGDDQYEQPLRKPRDAERSYSHRNREPRPQRLSPEERRQLRRDIKDAGREIYPLRRKNGTGGEER